MAFQQVVKHSQTKKKIKRNVSSVSIGPSYVYIPRNSVKELNAKYVLCSVDKKAKQLFIQPTKDKENGFKILNLNNSGYLQSNKFRKLLPKGRYFLKTRKNKGLVYELRK